MTDQTCRCGQPVTDAYLCRDCARRLRRMLTDLPALADDLEVTLTRQDRTQPKSDGGRSANMPLPLNLQASDVLGAIRATLVGWCRAVAEDWSLDLPKDSIPAMSVWLAGQNLRLHEAADEIHDEIQALHWRGRDVIQPRDRARFTVGPCPIVIDPDTDQPSTAGAGEPCPGQVVATIPHDEAVPPTMDCPACHTTWTAMQWLNAGKAILARQGQLDRQRQLAAQVLGRANG